MNSLAHRLFPKGSAVSTGALEIDLSLDYMTFTPTKHKEIAATVPVAFRSTTSGSKISQRHRYINGTEDAKVATRLLQDPGDL